MNIIALSGSGWTHRTAACRQMLSRLTRQPTAATAVIDQRAVEREAVDAAAPPLAPMTEFAFGDWVCVGAREGSELDVQAVRAFGQSVPPDQIVVVDARSQRPELVTAALGHLRHSWFHLDQWHPGFVLIADDVHLLVLAEMLSQTFYCQPQLLTQRELSNLVRQTMQRALFFRWLGPNTGRWLALRLARLQGRTMHVVDRLQGRA